MNREMSAEALLESAARLVDRALLQLNTSSAPCKCCARDTWANRLHAKMYEELNGVSDRLRRASARLESEQRGDEDTRPTAGYVESRTLVTTSEGDGR